jgi:hypothetical protein
MKLTAPQVEALRFYATQSPERWRADRYPRADVRGRLGALGLLSFRTAMVHVGTTYRSRQRLAVVDVYVTDAGRALLAQLPKEN